MAHSLLPDPWKGVPRGIGELTALAAEERLAKASLAADPGSAGFAQGAAQALQRKGHAANEAASLVASEIGIKAAPLDDALRASLVSIALSNNDVDDGDAVLGDASKRNWLREVKLSGNKLKAWPTKLASVCPALVSIDLSFNPRLSLLNADLRPFAGLLKLELAGLGLTNFTGADDDEDDDDDGGPPTTSSTATPLSALRSLYELNVSENDFERLEAFTPLAALKNLAVLDASGCPAAENGRYKRALLEYCPNLQQLDGDKTKSTMSGARPSATATAYEGSGTDSVFGANRDRSSCSCVEGNPCIDPTLCKDWRNRFTVAHEARKRKGIQEPPGLA